MMQVCLEIIGTFAILFGTTNGAKIMHSFPKPETFVFSSKTFAFFAKLLLSQEMLHSLATNLQSPEKLTKCLRTPKKHFHSLTKQLCSPKYFAFSCQTFSREMLYSLAKLICKNYCVVSCPKKSKVILANTIVLGENAKCHNIVLLRLRL